MQEESLKQQTLFSLIRARADPDSIREIVAGLSIQTGEGEGLQCDRAYFILFASLAALKRRLYHQVNRTEGVLDQPHAVQWCTREEALLGPGLIAQQASAMSPGQLLIFLCASDTTRQSFAPVVAGCFEPNK